MLFESWLEPDETMRHLLFPTLLEEGEAQKPAQTGRVKQFRKKYDERIQRIHSERIKVLVAQLESEPRRRELRSYLSWRDLNKDRTKFLDPKKVDRALALERTALACFAKSKNTLCDAQHGWCDVELEVEAMIRLAVEDQQVAADDPALPTKRQEWIARLRSRLSRRGDQEDLTHLLSPKERQLEMVSAVCSNV
jgi:hypothetical protein